MTFKTIENFRLVDGDKIDNLPVDTLSELANKEDTENKGQPNGYAELGADGRVPASQIPVGTGTGDMIKLVYDTDDSGVVDNSEALEGNDSAYHLDRANHTGTQTASTISDFDNAVANSTKVIEIDGKVDNNTSAISANTTAIANLATAQGQFESVANQIITTSEVVVPFNVITQSSNLDIFELNDVANTISFKVDAPFNFSTNMTIYTNVSQQRTLTVRGRKISDDSLVYERSVTVEQQNNTSLNLTSATLLTLGQGGYPSSPFDLYFTFQADDTGLEVREFSSILASGTQYNVDVATNWGDIGGTLSNQTDLQNELDSKADLSGGNTFSGNQIIDGQGKFQGGVTVGEYNDQPVIYLRHSHSTEGYFGIWAHSDEGRFFINSETRGLIFQHSQGITRIGQNLPLTILEGGNVGIGTTSPGSKLSIVGLPTSPTGLSSGDVWNDGGNLRIV